MAEGISSRKRSVSPGLSSRVPAALMPLLLGLILLVGVGCDVTGPAQEQVIVVNSLEDSASPAAGTTTLRSALAEIGSGGRITFDSALNGGTIELTIVGEAHSILRGELFAMVEGRWEFMGYQERDYGRSALYARKNVIIDASALPDGITLRWAGGEANPARVLAVYGDLVMDNVTVTAGISRYEAISGGTQPYTLGRGGGVAVWGLAVLKNCAIIGNRAEGDENGSRDRGTFGGGIYANRLFMEDCIVSGNAAIGYGAAGGGVYSVGGAADRLIIGSMLVRCVVTGNRVTAQHAYGGGVYTDGGGRGETKNLTLENCTIARNLVEDHPGLPQSPQAQYYYRGGGVYMSNGSLSIQGCTIVENAVTGEPAVFNQRPNMGGGGLAATIGAAHVVEKTEVWHSIVAGNTVNGNPEDLFTGSLVHFHSYGYNLVGRLDSDHILVPIPPWLSLSRKHWPKAGDLDGVSVSEVLALDGVQYHPWAVSVGADAGAPAVLWYPPKGEALNRIPAAAYSADWVLAEYSLAAGQPDDFLNRVLEKLRTEYGSILGDDFGAGFGDLTGVTFYGPAVTWPSNPENAPWIAFWRALDVELGDRLGTIKLGDDFWRLYTSGPLGPNITMRVTTPSRSVRLLDADQRGAARPSGSMGDVGAIEN